MKEIELSESVINNYTGNKTVSSASPALTILMEELDKLEDWQRILLLMRSQEVPYNEIARYTGKTEDNLKVYYGRLKKQLAEKVNKQLNTVKKQNVG